MRDPAARHASFEYYRTLDATAEHVQRWHGQGPLTIPVLAIGGLRQGAVAGRRLRS
ncbi:hypothetical protein ACIRG4_33140 [Streptomyces sp. NPDC102395]|uniref:hypothetical protein n=1 Tax=Streptomyces sp. NPDC102395 TaxID=3366168 RepID=UPI00382889BF